MNASSYTCIDKTLNLQQDLGNRQWEFFNLTETVVAWEWLSLHACYKYSRPKLQLTQLLQQESHP